MMFADWTERKRGRDDEFDDYENGTGFAEHRNKRRIATLPHRSSPNFTRNTTPPAFSFSSTLNTHSLTPADSESEGTPADPKSAFSPYSSSPGEPTPQILDAYAPSSQMTANTRASSLSLPEDLDMTDDVMHLSPAASQTLNSPSLSGRIPTPIHSSFSPFNRAGKFSQTQEDHYADDEDLVNRFKRGRRLPSPISEGEMSPSVLVDSMEDMQMEVDKPMPPPSQRDTLSDLPTPTKKGHQRSKHSVRQWSGYGGDLQSAGQGLRRSFSLGYRSDCEKCRLKVPGHFSHIITYGDDYVGA